jgi:predicted MPP superfamily phosphohydrolase
MYAVEGNHDTMGAEGEGVLALRHIEDVTNIKFLYNESLTLPELNVQLVGIEEAGQRKNKGLDTTLQASNIQTGNTFNILITHQPISLKKLVDFPIDLEVAGHTHKMQIRGLHFLSYLINDYTYGLYERQDKKAFITQGI